MVRVGTIHGRGTVVQRAGPDHTAWDNGRQSALSLHRAATTAPRRSLPPSSDVPNQKRRPPVRPATTLLASVERCSPLVVVAGIAPRRVALSTESRETSSHPDKPHCSETRLDRREHTAGNEVAIPYTITNTTRPARDPARLSAVLAAKRVSPRREGGVGKDKKFLDVRVSDEPCDSGPEP